MPRLNIYLPDQVYELARRWRDTSNLSEICARAIKDEFDAIEGDRSADSLFKSLRPPSEVEESLAHRHGLAEAVVLESGGDATKIRETIGRGCAAYLDRIICDGSMIALAGGRQMWCTVRNMSPRRVRTKITALGMHHADPVLLHAHPNSLATFLWLLYSPRSEAYVVGAAASMQSWTGELPHKPYPSYFVVSSCSPFEHQSPFAHLLSDEAKRSLTNSGAIGDFAYVFLNELGKEVEIPLAIPQMRLSGDRLKSLSARSDARVILVAGGNEKIPMIETILGARLCNTLVTDQATASRLLE